MAAAVNLVITGSTTYPPLVRILQARQINAALGGPFVAPWELDELPDVEIDAILSLQQDTSMAREANARIEARKAQIRAAHPTYGRGMVH